MKELFNEKSRDFCEVLYQDQGLCKRVIQLLAGDEIGDFEIDTKWEPKVHDYPYGSHIYVPCKDCNGQEYDVRIMTATEWGAHFKKNYFDELHREMYYYLPDPETPKSIVIIICNYDIARDEKIRHASQRVCQKAPSNTLYNAVEIYISATPETACDDSKLGKFVSYLVYGVPKDEITQKFHDGLLKNSK